MTKGEIAFFNLPAQGGNEQHGTRPAIIVSQKNNEPHKLLFVIPLTTKATALKFKNTLTIKPDSINNLPSVSYALTFQLRAISIERMAGSSIGRLDDETLEKINAQLRDIMGL